MGEVAITINPVGGGEVGGGGNITPTFGVDLVNLTATPASGYVFTHWSDLVWQPTGALSPQPLMLFQGDDNNPEIQFAYPYMGSPFDSDPGLNITAHFSSTAVDPHDVEVVLSSVPSTIDVTLTGGGTFVTGDTITIYASTDVQNYTFSHWDGQFWQNNQELFGDNTLPSQTFTIPEDYVGSILRMRANYEPATGDDDGAGENEFQFTVGELDIANIPSGTTAEQLAIIEERFGGLVYGQNNIDFEFGQSLPYVHNEPVNLSVELNEGYQFVEWYGGDSYIIEQNTGFDGTSNPITFNMLDVDTSFDLRINVVGPFTLSVGGEGGIVIPSSTGPFTSPDDQVSITATPIYGYEFTGWVGDTDFIVDNGTINDETIQVSVGLSNIILAAEFQSTVQYIWKQSVGPYTDDLHYGPFRQVFQPKQGRDLTVLNPDSPASNGSSAIFEERDGRFSLGTYTLNNRNFWENITFNSITRNSFFKEENLKTTISKLTETPDGPVVFPRRGMNSTQQYSVEAMPFIIDENQQVIRLDEYYDKEIDKDLYEITTEGEIYFRISVGSSGRTSDGNMRQYSPHGDRTSYLESVVVPSSNTGPYEQGGIFVTQLDWGDGEVDHTTKPELLTPFRYFNHNYEKPGFYTIRGVVFRIATDDSVYWWERFETNMIINPSDNYENPFFDYNNFATIGGISLESSYAKTLFNLAGFNPITKEERLSAVIDDYNEFDKLGLMNTIAKFGIQYVSEQHIYFVNEYKSSRFDDSENKIYNGVINKKFFNSFQNTDLYDVDISLTKMYNGVVNMWEHLGFSSSIYDNPNEDVYWKNIIPKTFTFGNLTNVQIQDGQDPISGSMIPRTSYKEIIIDEDIIQRWEDGYSGKKYYYPILPKLNKFGMFTEVEPDTTFFGSKTTWDGEDDAPITDKDEMKGNLILNIDFQERTTDDIFDKTNIFDLIYNQDFQVELDENLRIKKSTIQNIPDPIEQLNNEQAF